MDLSIIIAAYNIAKYIDNCISSVLDQNISDYEVIIVNDGSTDQTLEHVERFAKNNDKIKIVTQPNQGLSAARNNGLRYASGKYIWYIDGDDAITPNCLKDLLNICKSYCPDMLCVGPSLPFRIQFPSDFNAEEYIKEYNNKEWIKSSYRCIGAWSYIFNREFWINNKLQFLKGIYFEDLECISKTFWLARKICTLTRFSVYNYIQRDSSIMHSNFNKKKILSINILINSLESFSQNIDDKDFKEYYMGICTGSYISALQKISQNKELYSDYNKYINLLRNNCKIEVSADSAIKKLYQFVAIYYPQCFVRFYHIIRKMQ